MRRQYGWIVVALGCFVGGTAHGQQTYDSDQPSEQMPGDLQQPPGGIPPEGEPPQQQPSEAMQAEPQAEPTRADAAARKPQPHTDGVRLSQLDQQQVMDLQRSLQEAGYYTAEIDGLAGPQTRRALRRFYGDQAQLAAQGMILPAGAAALGLDEAEIERVSGQEEQEGTDEPARTPGGAQDTPRGGGATDMPGHDMREAGPPPTDSTAPYEPSDMETDVEGEEEVGVPDEEQPQRP